VNTDAGTRLRVLQLIPVCGDSVARVAREYARALLEAGHEVVVAHLFCNAGQDGLDWDPRIELRHLDLPEREPRGLRRQGLAAVRALLDERWDLILCHRHKAATLLASHALLHPRQPLPPLVYVVHGMRALSGFVRALRALQARALLRGRFTLVPVSHYIAAELRASGWIGRQDRVWTVQNSLDIPALMRTQLSQGKARQALGLPERALLFGTLGRLVGFKNQRLLLHAFARIATSLPDARLVMIGGGKLEADLKAQARDLGIAARVDFLGQVDEGARYLRALDLFCFSSPGEPFGLAVLEAMSAGLPVIAVDSGGVAEVLGETGIRVVNDAEAFAAAMLRAARMDAATRAAIGALGRERAQRHFAASSLPRLLSALGLPRETTLLA
jgi:glycosyltransferase involved in cell wall biosynthesis